MMFECPACGKQHSVPDNYDKEDFICPNTANAPNQKVFQDIVPENQLSRNVPNWNRFSTLTDEARPVTIVNIKPSRRPDGTDIDKERTYNY